MGIPIDAPGGINSCIKNIAKVQEAKGLQVQIIDNFSMRRLKSNAFFDSNKGNSNRPNLVNHFHFSLTYLKAELALRSFKEPARNIFHFHGPWADESRVQTPKRHFRNLTKEFIEKITYQRFDTIIAASDSFRDLLVNQFGIDPRKVFVIGLGVDLEKFEFRDDEIKSDETKKWRIGTLRRLVPRMGIENLIQAMTFLDNHELVIGGSGPLETELKLLVDRLGLQDRVKLAGKIPNEDLAAFYDSLDLFVIPSIALEGFGLVALESFACGTPVIASNIGGLKDSVGGFSRDLLFEPRSIESIVESIHMNVSRKSSEKHLMRKYAESNSWERTVDIIENLILQGRQ
jgi:glycosyltransferase involved in cell wall biosynthesis